MAKIVAYILGTEKYPHRLEMLSRNGIKNINHDLEVIVLGEGKRPSVLKKSFTWLDWGHMRVADKHIMVLNQKKHPEADYYIFADDDSFTNIDHMVEELDKENEINKPCHWSGHPGHMCPPDHISYLKSTFSLSNKQIKNIANLWIGFECTIMNNAFINRAANSAESKQILQTTKDILKNGDLSACLTGALIDSKPFKSSKITQFKQLLNYSGLVSNGNLFHIHYTGDNGILEKDSLISALENGPVEKSKAVSSIFKGKLKYAKLKPKNYVNKKFVLNYFFMYWTWGGWHAPAQCPDSFCQDTIILKRDGSIISDKGLSTLWSWKQCKKGFILYHNNNIWSEFYWDYQGNPVGSSCDILWMLKECL